MGKVTSVAALAFAVAATLFNLFFAVNNLWLAIGGYDLPYSAVIGLLNLLMAVGVTFTTLLWWAE